MKNSNYASENISIPLNFMIRIADKGDFIGQRLKLNNERIYQFASIGIRNISNALFIDASAWRYEARIDWLDESLLDIEQSPPKRLGLEQSQPKRLGLEQSQPKRLGLEQSQPKRLDYNVNSCLASPWSNQFSFSSSLSKLLLTIIKIDKDLNNKKTYRIRIAVNAQAKVMVEKPKDMCFNVTIKLFIQKKSRSAAAKHFRGFNSVDLNYCKNIGKELENHIFESYVTIFRTYGIIVTESETNP